MGSSVAGDDQQMTLSNVPIDEEMRSRARSKRTSVSSSEGAPLLRSRLHRRSRSAFEQDDVHVGPRGVGRCRQVPFCLPGGKVPLIHRGNHAIWDVGMACGVQSPGACGG